MEKKPCPFCGSDDLLPSFHTVNDYKFVAVACDECEAEGPTVAIDDDHASAVAEAYKLWNGRK